jgi:hypothetical protein
MLIVAVFSMLLDVTTYGTSTLSRFGTIEVGEVRFTTTSLFSNCFLQSSLFITYKWSLPFGAMGTFLSYLFNNNIQVKL